jgi:hypothetical protein
VYFHPLRLSRSYLDDCSLASLVVLVPLWEASLLSLAVGVFCLVCSLIAPVVPVVGMGYRVWIRVLLGSCFYNVGLSIGESRSIFL